MKLRLIQIVLALVLVCNPVAVLVMAVEMTPESGLTSGMPCHTGMTTSIQSDSAPAHDSEMCMMDCCDNGLDCPTGQTCQDCFSHYSLSALLLSVNNLFSPPPKTFLIADAPRHLDPVLPPDQRPPLNG